MTRYQSSKLGANQMKMSHWLGLILIGGLSFTIMAATMAPIRVSSNGRYFVDGDSNPFYFLGDTQWELFRLFTLDEARRILDDRKSRGFSVVMVMLCGIGDATKANLQGQTPWLNNNPATPNEQYFAHVDSVVRLAEADNIQLLIGIYHQAMGNRIDTNNAKPWAAWISARYHNSPNIIWTMYPQANDSYKPLCNKLAEGILQSDSGRHLISIHPDPSPTSSSFMQTASWLDFNSIQVWDKTALSYTMTIADYNRTPIKPVTMLEGGYEDGSEYGFRLTPLLARRQAYYTCLAGGFHSYGHRKLVGTSMAPGWQTFLGDTGAQQMTIMRNLFTGLKNWWTLIPDQALLTTGGTTSGELKNLSALSSEGTWLIAFVAGAADITVDMSRITAADSAIAQWINPADSLKLVIGTFPATGTRSFSRPSGWPDGLLIVSVKDGFTSITNGLKMTEPQKASRTSKLVRQNSAISDKIPAYDLGGKQVRKNNRASGVLIKRQ
jgi:hypothetical protein